MTWILGSASPFGYGALISDTCVTFPDGSQHEMLQKVHPVGRMLVAGFAGSVRIGYHMLWDMSLAFVLETDEIWYPRIAAWQWHRRGRRLFAQAQLEERRLHCSLLLVGATAELNGPFNRAYCIRMRSPDFLPEFVRHAHWVSIGNGAAHEYARTLAQNARVHFETHGPMEVGSQFGSAFSTATIVGVALQRAPIRGVGEALQVAIASADTCHVRDLRTSLPSRDGAVPRTIEVDVARSWLEFRDRCSQLGHATACATA